MKEVGRTLLIAWCAAGAALLGGRLEEIFYVPPGHPAIQYDVRPARDPVALLQQRLDKGQVKLQRAPNGWGYLPSILKELGIRADSQVLVFSKTSIQSERIGPATPRAIYFSDDAAVGFVQGGMLELSGVDPEQGVVFYTLDPEAAEHPRFGRDDSCLRCHQGPPTLGVPGLMVSSIRPRSEGSEGHGSSYVTDDRVSLADRWGGWYVTGTTGSQAHLGNNTNLVDPVHPGGPREGTQNITDLAKFFDTSRYLAPTSDVVALMTLEHQVRMTNLMTRIGWDARIALHDHSHGGKLDDDARREIDEEIEQMLAYMLFADEAPLSGPVAGVSSFARTFAARGPRDRRGRSLRDFDLRKRLFKYPLSYMIYSGAFDALPGIVRERVYQRLYEILSGKDQNKPFDRLSAEDRRAIMEIVRDTKPHLPPYWRAD